VLELWLRITLVGVLTLRLTLVPELNPLRELRLFIPVRVPLDRAEVEILLLVLLIPFELLTAEPAERLTTALLFVPLDFEPPLLFCVFFAKAASANNINARVIAKRKPLTVFWYFLANIA